MEPSSITGMYFTQKVISHFINYSLFYISGEPFSQPATEDRSESKQEPAPTSGMFT